MKQFEWVKMNSPKKSVFDLSHERKFTMDMGYLVPVFMQEVLPGDDFRVSLEAMVRMNPMLAPVMHRVDVYTHFFFVPNRIIWEDWEKFITGGPDGDLAPAFPTINGAANEALAQGNMSIGSLADYLGIPVQMIPNDVTELTPLSQLPFRAYQQIYNDYYRDQNLIDEIPVIKTSGQGVYDDEEILDLMEIRKRAWEKDYFTSALPFAQRGDSVTLPLGEQAPLKSISLNLEKYPLGGNPDNGATSINANILRDSSGNALQIQEGMGYADLSNATAASVNELRRAFALQRWLEKMARGGARYIEQMLVMFGVRSSDARLQRAEFLGGGKMPVKIAEVLQTSETNTTAQGNMSGHGISAGNVVGFKRRFEEHGIILGIMSIKPRTAYMQGLPKYFEKNDRFDFYWPDFAHIGEQPIKTNELYWQAGTNYDSYVFGYQPRYSEYRYAYDSVHGEFRDTLKFWHMAQEFQGEPQLNQNFVECNPTNRIYPVPAADQHLLVQTFCKCTAIRPVSKFGEPI